MKIAAWIVIGFGVWYFMLRNADGEPLADLFDGVLFPTTAPTMRPISAQQAAINQYAQAKGPGNTPSVPYTSSSLPTGAISSAGAAGIAGAVGLTTGAAVATAGIAAGVGLLVWGISDQGWFRGGEEGVKVNPARDRYLGQFAQYDYMTDSRNPPGFYGLSLVLTHLNAHPLFDQLERADTMAAFNSAVSSINNRLTIATQDEYNRIMSAVAAYRAGAVA